MKIAIDGTSSSGKSSIAKALSKVLNIAYFNTGLIYRAAGYLNVNESNVDNLLKKLNIILDIGKTSIFFENKEITDFLSSEDIASKASIIAANKEIREKLVFLQKALINEGSVVVEGRDAASVILKDADIKFFIDADIKERAYRRWKENKEKDYFSILKALEERDQRDKLRDISPLKPQENSIIIDTTCKTLEEVIDFCLKIIRNK